ncbi:MAG: PAAR-like protein [Acidiferrobacterales bacterium]
MPCIPTTDALWVPGSLAVLIGNMPALNSESRCLGNCGGEISMNFPGQVGTSVA